MRTRSEALAVLVRAPAVPTYGVLTDVDGWDVWWPDCRTRRASEPPSAPDAPPADHHLLHLPTGRPCRLRVHGWRHEVGLRGELRGGADADVEWWLEPRPDGTTVVHLLVTARGRRAARTVAQLGDGLQALKDHLELAVAVAAGHIP